MLRIGLTGGIGSGKTTVSKWFRALGVPVIDADELSHALSKRGQTAFDEIVAAFGKSIVGGDGELDRARLRQLVFDDRAKRALLESILHPRIRAEIDRQVSAAEGKAPYCVLSIPLLIEGNRQDQVDRVLVVDAPDEQRIEWIRARSGLSESEIRDVFRAQASREERLAAADDVIINEGTIEELERQVVALHQAYLKLASLIH